MNRATAKKRLDASLLYKDIQRLFKEVNNENNLHRNSRCVCGSGKKWKKCCMRLHEEKTEVLEQKVKEYKELCQAINGGVLR